MGCIFCLLPMTDLICALFSAVKQSMNAEKYLPTNTKIPKVTYEGVVEILSDDLQKTGCLEYILKSFKSSGSIINNEQDSIIPLEDIITLGIKYPILFYSCRLFQNNLRRLFFGDIFFQNHNYLKSRLEYENLKEQMVIHNFSEYNQFFVTETIACQLTAKNILTDIFHMTWVDNNIDTSKSILNEEKKKTKIIKSALKRKSTTVIPFMNNNNNNTITSNSDSTQLNVVEMHSELSNSNQSNKSKSKHSKEKLKKKQIINNATSNNSKSLNNSSPTKIENTNFKVMRDQTKNILTFIEPEDEINNTNNKLSIIDKGIIKFRKFEKSRSKIKLELNIFNRSHINEVDEHLYAKLKNLLGYRLTRKLIIESELTVLVSTFKVENFENDMSESEDGEGNEEDDFTTVLPRLTSKKLSSDF